MGIRTPNLLHRKSVLYQFGHTPRQGEYMGVRNVGTGARCCIIDGCRERALAPVCVYGHQAVKKTLGAD